MIGTAEFVADALGLACAMVSWLFIFLLSIGIFALAQILGSRPASLAAAEGLVVILIGLFLQWLADGVLRRGRGRIALTCLLCVLMGLLEIRSSLIAPARDIYLVAQAFLDASQFLAAALFLGVVLFRRGRAEP
jgi:hypothetical protein